MKRRQVISYPISTEADGRTVERFLRARGFSRRLLIHTKQQPEGLLLDGMPVHTNAKLRAGQMLTVHIPPETNAGSMQPVRLPLDILYEDSDILVLNKPAGMPVHPSQGHHSDTLCNALAFFFAEQDEPFSAHAIGRLDRDTSGVVLFARHALSSCILAEAMRRREIHREYRAICTGILPGCGTIDAPIARAPGSTIARVVDDAHGERAVTHFQRLAVCGGFSLAAVRLETGRTHQIRVHMKHIGHPLPGDFLYNPDYSRIARQALHSYHLAFAHPITCEPLTFTAPMPEDMTAFLPDSRSPASPGV